VAWSIINKGLLSKFLFFLDKDLSINVIKCLLSYDKTLMISLSKLNGILMHYNLFYIQNALFSLFQRILMKHKK